MASRAQTGQANTRSGPSAAVDPVAGLQQGLEFGKLKLARDPNGYGYLPSLLKALDLPVDSQVLVFTKSSLQFREIGPQTPRAIYFNDDTALGAVQGGELFEIITADARGRVAFYSMQQNAEPKVELERPRCLMCHGAIGPAAGMIVANTIPQEDGTPEVVRLDRVFELTDSTTPFEKRWGGWYVTGLHGDIRHKGNVTLDAAHQYRLDPVAGQNVTDIASRFDATRYLAPTSDIVALMTLEHQIGVMNRVWTIEAMLDAQESAGQLTPPAGLDRLIEDLVRYMVGVDDAPLTSPVKGVSNFTQTFAARSPRDAQGRSLREFDLQTRLFRYPLSYMIYSRAFNGLPTEQRNQVYRRLFEVLSGQDRSPEFARLSPEARAAAMAILRSTKPDLPAYWRGPQA
jgi:hypothetical protein